MRCCDIEFHLVEQLDKEVDRLEEHELVVVDVDAVAEVQTRVSPIDNLVRAELARKAMSARKLLASCTSMKFVNLASRLVTRR